MGDHTGSAVLDASPPSGEYGQEVDTWRTWNTPLTGQCGQCGMPVAAGLICQDQVCIKTRTEGCVVDASWLVVLA